MHLHGIKEMPAGYDAEVAELFRDLRAASGLSETDLAAQLATRPEVVLALEQGAIYALPPWPETCRVVSTYGTLLNLDVRPLLRRIYAQIEAGIVELAPKPMPEVPVMPPPQNGAREPDFQPRNAGQRLSESFPAQPPRLPQQQRPQQMPDRRQAQPQRQHPQSFPQGAPQRGMPPPPLQQQQRPQAPRGLRVETGQRPQQKALPPPQARQQPGGAPAQQPKQRQAKPAPQPAAKPAKTAGRGFLKWGILLLVASAAAFGLWMWFSQAGPFGFSTPTAETGSETPSSATSDDPNDPRSRKGDRLPRPPS